jgi:hypothetical protein
MLHTIVGVGPLSENVAEIVDEERANAGIRRGQSDAGAR